VSNDAVNWVRRLGGLSTGEKFVLWVIADRYNEQEKCAFPGRKSIAKETNMSVRTVSRHIQTLKNWKFEPNGLPVLVVQSRFVAGSEKNYTNKYFLPAYDPESGKGEPEERCVFVSPVTGKYEEDDEE
jgi:biotin operon repressor